MPRLLSISELDTRDWRRYPLKHCQSDRHCEIGSHPIDLGELYYDGGPTRRACRACVKNMLKSALPDSTEPTR